MSQGCQKKLPPPEASNKVLTPDEALAKPMLTDSEESEALAAMRAVAEGHTRTATPHAAAFGVRWSDMYASVVEAVIEQEIGIYDYTKTDVSYHFVLRTIDDRPGTLDIRRRDDERVYVAEAAIGRFGDPAAELALLQALDRHLRAFGTKRRFDD